MIKLVVFDMAGTTVQDDDGVSNAFHAALQAEEVDVPETEITRVMGLPKPEAIRQLLLFIGRTADTEEVSRIHLTFVKKMKDYYAQHPDVGEIPGATAIFTRLRTAGVKVALNTGFSREIVEVLLNRLGWTVPEVIDATICSDEVKCGRPYPDMIQQLMTQLNVNDTNQVAKIGDTWADLEEGNNTKCGLVIGVTTGTFTREQLSSRPHTHIVESIREVPALFGLA
jgi:phosphonatase-like hydrolase